MPRLRRCFPLLGLSLLVAALAAVRAADAPETTDTTAADEKLLQDRGVKTDGAGLLAFLRERSLDEDERAQMAQLVKQLGDTDFDKREEASKKFVARGRVSLPFLRPALKDNDPEIARRAQACIEEISGGPGPALPCAAVRHLVRKKPDGAVEMLLRYAPFADDESVEDEVLNALRALALRDGKAVDAVVAALKDKQAPRRAAAAFVVAAAKDKDQRDAAAALLRDEAPGVRFRTVQGLLAARDPRAVPVLIDFLRGRPDDFTWRAEDLLIRLAGEKAPTTSLTSEDDRKKAHGEWSAWWKENEKKVDLAKIDEAPPFLNLTLVCEMHGNKIWEVDQAGKVRWTMDKLNCPRDAQILPGGRILITEVNDHKIREREIATSKVLWEHDIQDPSFVRRLPSGNTFIADHYHCYEITPAGKKVFEYKPTDQGYLIHSIDRKPNGNVVCMMMDGRLREVGRDGKTVRELNVQNNGGNWCGVQALPGDRYLCVEFNNGGVFEFDAEGKVQWKTQIQGASYALRLPNGRTMICCFGGQRVVHVDRDGKVVWETKVNTQPWRARVR
jgi:HEAT repeat protein